MATRDLARALLRAGHQTVVYCPRPTQVSEEVCDPEVIFTDDLTSLKDPPDIIHGHHHEPLMEALLNFPKTSAIYVCHDATNALDTPHAFPRIRRYLAVDERCRARVERTLGVVAGKVEIVPNAVDTDRFKPRAPLPKRPRRALVFSNYAHGSSQVPAIRKACRKAGIKVDVVGRAMGTANTSPESILPHYDLVFAKGRCALEAMAVGNAVVLCDFSGVGPYLTAPDFDAMRYKNFGITLLTEPLSADTLLKQISRYDPSNAETLSTLVRSKCSLNEAVPQWESIYRKVLKEFDVAQLDAAEESRAAAVYLTRWHYFRRRDWEIAQLRRLERIPILGQAIYRSAIWSLMRWRPFDELLETSDSAKA